MISLMGAIVQPATDSESDRHLDDQMSDQGQVNVELHVFGGFFKIDCKFFFALQTLYGYDLQ